MSSIRDLSKDWFIIVFEFFFLCESPKFTDSSPEVRTGAALKGKLYDFLRISAFSKSASR